MSFVVTCKACGLTFEVNSGSDGQLCTCPKCFETGHLKAVDEDEWELEVDSKGG